MVVIKSNLFWLKFFKLIVNCSQNPNLFLKICLLKEIGINYSNTFGIFFIDFIGKINSLTPFRKKIILNHPENA